MIPEQLEKKLRKLERLIRCSKCRMVVPNMTEDERDEIDEPSIGQLIFNLDSGKFNGYTPGGWEEITSA
jgi:hypothetical protein